MSHRFEIVDDANFVAALQEKVGEVRSRLIRHHLLRGLSSFRSSLHQPAARGNQPRSCYLARPW